MKETRHLGLYKTSNEQAYTTLRLLDMYCSKDVKFHIFNLNR